MTAIVALLAAGVAGGVVLLIAGISGAGGGEPAGPQPRPAHGWLGPSQSLASRVAPAVIGAVVVAVTTRWPVGVVLAAVLGWSLPHLFGANASARAAIVRVEAIATWVEHLRDTMSGGARGLTQAIMTTAGAAPDAIREEVAELAAELAQRERLDRALRRFAERLADPSADQVVIALLLVASPQQRFGAMRDALTELATATRERVKMRLRVEVGQARMRNVARFIVVWTIGFIGLQLLATRQFLEPYGTLQGQLVLLLIGGVFAAGLVWLDRMSRGEEPERFLAAEPSDAAAGAAAWAGLERR